MKDKEKILRYVAASGEEAGEMAVRLLDLAETADKGRPYAVSPFMPPFAVQIAATAAAHMKTVSMESWGGYHEAERVKIAFKNLSYSGVVDFGITALSVSWDSRYRLIGHRDVMGSLLALGIDRAVLGDILMQPSGAQIFIEKKMTEWLKQNFQKVAMVPVSIEEISPEDVHPPEETAKEVRATVASLRLDAVGAAGFGISRAKMAAAVDGQKVQVNWQIAKGVSQSVSEGDIVSLRGRGRIVLKAATGVSRKGRTGILVEKYR